jgi:hypothetical protein
MIIVIAASRLPVKVGVMKEPINTTDKPGNEHESIYDLLIHSEEKSRNIFEMVIYPLLILGPVIAIWQFAQQPVNIPAAGLKGASSVALVASVRNNAVKG